MARAEVIRTIKEQRLIVIVRGVRRGQTVPLMEALYRGGIRVTEITFDASGRTSDAETEAILSEAAAAMQGRMYLGAGTVLSPVQAERVKRAGGTFVVSPDVNPAVIRRTRSLGMVSVPGALAPSDITEAVRSGGDIIKLFPAGIFGTDYVRQIRAPLSSVPLFATGGIDEASMAGYAAAGISGFCIGSAIVKKSLLESNDFAGIEALAASYAAAAAKLFPDAK